MKKKEGIFKEMRRIGKNYPAVALALVWASLIPSISSLFLVPLAVNYLPVLELIDFTSLFIILIFVCTATLLMGFALIPTTLFAALSGFLFGWQAFIWVVIGYTMATLLGYAWGKKLGGNNLEVILQQYPKARDLLQKKEGRIGELIFFVRLSPAIPFALSNLLFALIKSGWKKIVIFGTLGMLPRTTLVFFSGTIASNSYAAIQQDGINGKGEVFILLLIFSIWGIWRYLKK